MKICPALSALSICLMGPALGFSQGPALRGYLSRDVAAQQKLEQQALDIPEAANLRRYLNFMAAEPHHAGSPRSRVVADYILNKLQSWGIEAHIEEFEALMPYPTVRVLEVLSPIPYTARLKEPPIAQDPTSGQADQLPTYNAYSATGDVTAEVVYANYGLPEDYEWLAKQNISVKGKIVLTRYGKSWRGIKPKIAAEHGALGCLIYSDPRDDGYFENDVYPKGPMRPPQGVQRGSVMDMTIYPGDPLSPGWASEKGSRRLTIAEAKTLMKIPVLPISYADAKPILEQLTGPIVPSEWRGALPLTYHAGPGATRLHLKTDFDWTNKPLFDVIATIPGSESPDEWILAGNHHDAWVNGAEDPLSGAVALLETARTLATLQKQGWSPKRSIKFTFWDGEEFGLLGSTEWVEKHQDELRQKAAVYINSDDSDKGWLHIGGSHSLEAFASDVADSVPQPGATGSLLGYALHHPPAPTSDQPPAATKPFALSALGAGSDFQGFLDYVGVASLNNGFSGQTDAGIYHSVYDSIYWYTHFSDTTQVDGRALSRFTAASLLRLGDATVLPFEFTRLGNTITGYLDEIQKEADGGQHKIDLSNLRRQVDTLTANGTQLDALLETIQMKPALDADRVKGLNRILIRTERSLLKSEGLPNRPWYKHQLYAPGFYTGYAVKTLPGIREAVEARNWTLAQQEAGILSGCLSDLNDLLDQASTQLAGL